MPQIAIIILNWNRARLTLNTLASLSRLKHSGFSFHIFVLDNGSTDNSPQILKTKLISFKNSTLLTKPQNLGFAAGNNLVIKKVISRFDYLLICNNDIQADPQLLVQLYSASQKYPQAAFVGPKIYFAPGYEFHSRRYTKKQQGRVIWFAGGRIDWHNVLGKHIGVDEVDRGQFNQPRTDIDFLTGCCFLASTSALKKIGLFDPKYFMYLEDMDICQRAKQKGYQLLFWPLAKIWHLNSGSSASGSQLHDYFISRNRLYFARKFVPLKTKLSLHRQALGYIFSSNHWKRQAVIDYYLGRMGRGSWR